MIPLTIRLWLRALVPLTVGVLGVFAIVRTQPYDDGGLQTFLASEACSLPCFLGIQPGVTNWLKAIQLLEASPWVASVENLHNDEALTWTWNGTQPPFLRNEARANQVLMREGLVYRVDLLTGVDMATFRLLFNVPDSWFSSIWSINNPAANTGTINNFQYYAIYADSSLLIVAEGRCPQSISEQWAQPTHISLLPASADLSVYLPSAPTAVPQPKECV